MCPTIYAPPYARWNRDSIGVQRCGAAIPCNPHDNPKGKNMIEAIVIAAFVAIGSQVPSTFFGPHQSAPSDCEKVAVTSERTGEVLYYNCAR